VASPLAPGLIAAGQRAQTQRMGWPSDVVGAVRTIVAARPDVILNTINRPSNVAFFRTLRAAGVMPGRTPTVSFSISEEELTRDFASAVLLDLNLRWGGHWASPATGKERK
jgi:hypothetical protein